MQAREVQNLVGDIVGQLESIKNTMTWAYPPMTMYLLYASMIATVITYFLPTSWLLFAGGLYMFADGFVLAMGLGKARDPNDLILKVRQARLAKKQKAKLNADEDEPTPDWEKFVMQVSL